MYTLIAYPRREIQPKTLTKDRTDNCEKPIYKLTHVRASWHCRTVHTNDHRKSSHRFKLKNEHWRLSLIKSPYSQDLGRREILEFSLLLGEESLLSTLYNIDHSHHTPPFCSIFSGPQVPFPRSALGALQEFLFMTGNLLLVFVQKTSNATQPWYGNKKKNTMSRHN